MDRSARVPSIKGRAGHQRRPVPVWPTDRPGDLPQGLLDYLSALPADTSDTDDTKKPPRKRARVEPTMEPITITRQSITITAPKSDLRPKPDERPAVSCTDAGRYMRLDHDKESQSLVISAKLPSQNPLFFESSLHLGDSNPTDPVRTILHVLASNREDESLEGALWVAFNIAYDPVPTDTFHLSLELKWNPSTSYLRNARQRALSQQVLDTFFHSKGCIQSEDTEKLKPQAFYEVAFMPEKDAGEDCLPDEIPGLEAQLFPFQRRALKWLLGREGVKDVASLPDDPQGAASNHALDSGSPTSHLPLSFTTAKDADGHTYYVSDLYHVVTREISPFQKMESDVKGGILAEEMGLGKTVEVISLITMHKRQPQPPQIFDKHTQKQVRPTSATLIIAPAPLMNQWRSELNKHAPTLRVMTYHGRKCLNSRGPNDIGSELAEQDVVLTTYNVLQSEIWLAETPPERSRRHERKYERPMSPLVQLSWWRVCLDEAQQIENGVSKAAKVARLIPRINAWGITGTPIKDNIKDLWGLLLFLRCEPFASSLAIWEGSTTTHKVMFRVLFNQIALRHTKVAVRDELTLPPQKRYVITMPITAVEEQYYMNCLKQNANNWGLDEQGNHKAGLFPRSDVPEWFLDSPNTVEGMRRTLNLLRQHVLHPNMLSKLSQRKKKPLQTMEEVLDDMIEKSMSMIWADQRAYLIAKLKRGQLVENSPLVKQALALWEEVRREIKPIVEERRDQLRLEMEKARQESNAEDDDIDPRDSSPSQDHLDDEGNTTRVGECRRKLRSALDIEHRAVFFIASAYFQIKTNKDMTEPNSEEYRRLGKLEDEGYELAKKLRHEILHEAHTKASLLMEKIQKNAKQDEFVVIPAFRPYPVRDLKSRKVWQDLETVTSALNEQAGLLDDWRKHTVKLLLRPLVDEEGEAEVTGDEYEDSTKIQDELMAYTLVLRAAIADRQDCLRGSVNERVKYETGRATTEAQRGNGHAPELTLELLQRRKDANLPSDEGSCGAISSQLRELATRYGHESVQGSERARIELDMIERQFKGLQEQVGKQREAIATLESELDQFTAAMNSRVAFYRQLQAVSDTVTPEDKEDGEDAIATELLLLEEEQALRDRVTAAQVKYRYLLYLKEDGKPEDQDCVICQGPINLGILTVCGHRFCKECMMCWWKTSHKCPICQRQLTLATMHDMTLKKLEPKFHEVRSQVSRSTTSPSKTKQAGIYSQFSEAKLGAIAHIKLDVSHGTKIDFLVKHIFWLREEDPGAKSVIFSQFKGYLDALAKVFQQHGIRFTTFDTSGGGARRFREDPGMECFLMDARAHAGGLNLVEASHMFLCEPMLNTALELQAIARVDRIGQENETTVWLSVADNTVEESIYKLSVQRRMERMRATTKGKSKETAARDAELGLQTANSREMQEASLSKLMSKGARDGEVIHKRDLWECLFGYFNVTQEQATMDSQQRHRHEYVPAEAGPSSGSGSR